MLYMYVSYIFIGDYAIKSNIKCHLNSIHTSKVDTYNNLQKNINLFGFQLFFHKKSIKQNKLQSSESFLFICGNSNIVILAFSCLKLFKYVFNFFSLQLTVTLYRTTSLQGAETEFAPRSPIQSSVFYYHSFQLLIEIIVFSKMSEKSKYSIFWQNISENYTSFFRI